MPAVARKLNWKLASQYKIYGLNMSIAPAARHKEGVIAYNRPAREAKTNNPPIIAARTTELLAPDIITNAATTARVSQKFQRRPI